MPWENNGRKRRHSDVLQDPYRGPQEFMEAGVRGFLVTAIPDREEHAVDEALRCLRKVCVKLYGGIKPLRKEDATFAKGCVMIDFMDPETIVHLPHPDAEKFAAEQKAKEEAEAAAAAAKKAKETEEMEEESKKAEEAKEDQEKTEIEETKGEEDEGAKAKAEKEKEEQKKKEELRKKRLEEEEKAKPPLMLAPHKFKGFRTELRNIMFIKSDVVDPVEVVNGIFDLIVDRKPLFSDCINQILPIQGVCDNDYKQLEIMCRRVLAPYVGEHLEEPPSFGVMLIDKMCEPGSEVLLEVVRSVIWCLNPMAWQSSPWSEPDVTIHVEIIGSKIILSAMPQYMKYRQYSPFALHELGHGKPEDEVKILKKEQEEIDREKAREAAEHEQREREQQSRRKKKDKKKDDNKDKKKDEAKEKKKEEEEKKEDDETKTVTEETSKDQQEEEKAVEEVKAETEEENKETMEEASEEKKSTGETKRSSRSKGDKKKS